MAYEFNYNRSMSNIFIKDIGEIREGNMIYDHIFSLTCWNLVFLCFGIGVSLRLPLDPVHNGSSAVGDPRSIVSPEADFFTFLSSKGFT